MNIFILDLNPKTCAQYHCDKHVVKMILETAQLLSTAQHVLGANNSIVDILYKPTHANHPCATWTRTSLDNYLWLCSLGIELCKEYTFRYGKKHKSEDIIYLCKSYLPTQWWIDCGLTEFALAMPSWCMLDDAVSSYRNYYLTEKSSILQYTKREIPSWIRNNSSAIK